ESGAKDRLDRLEREARYCGFDGCRSWIFGGAIRANNGGAYYLAGQHSQCRAAFDVGKPNWSLRRSLVDAMAPLGAAERTSLYGLGAMIFVTVGTQGRFDRLIRTVDQWAGAKGGADVFAQTGPSDYHCEHVRAERFIDPTDFRKRVEAASVVISHAGMGSIITAL